MSNDVVCIPYKGSKRKIARQLIELIPSAPVFVDLFSGGGAMTTAALESGKFNRVIMNDTEKGLTQLYVDAIHGKYADEVRWISRADFYALKDSDPYVRFCWSFGNNGRDYLYSRTLESYKKAYHYAAVFNDNSLFADMGIHTPELHMESIHERRMALRKWLGKNVKNVIRTGDLERLERLQSLERLERLQSLERLERLQSLESLERLQSLESLERLERLESDYRDVHIPSDAVVYCDIPYIDTNKYGKNKQGFDHEAFYAYVRELPNLCFVSEYTMPSDFVSIWEKPHQSSLCATKVKQTLERLYVHESKMHLLHDNE